MKMKKVILLGFIALLLSHTSVYATNTVESKCIDPEPWCIEVTN